MTPSTPETRQEHNEIHCRKCKAVLRLAHNLLNARTGGWLRMYKCGECGEQMWVDIPA
jgi:uncharacterized Zn finger protein